MPWVNVAAPTLMQLYTTHGLPGKHRAIGITTYLHNGGTIKHAQRIANRESPRTTKLYDRTNDAISLDERACPAVSGIERVLI